MRLQLAPSDQLDQTSRAGDSVLRPRRNAPQRGANGGEGLRSAVTVGLKSTVSAHSLAVVAVLFAVLPLRVHEGPYVYPSTLLLSSCASMCEEKTLQRYGLYPYQLYRSGTLGLCQPPYAGEYRELEGPRRG